MNRLLSDANFLELMQAASLKLGRRECLILAELDDDPSSITAQVEIGDELVSVKRDAIVAYRR